MTDQTDQYRVEITVEVSDRHIDSPAEAVGFVEDITDLVRDEFDSLTVTPAHEESSS